MSNNITGLRIIVPTEEYEERQQSWHSTPGRCPSEEPESIKQEGQGSFKLEEKLSGKKRKAEGFCDDLPRQSNRQVASINSK